MGPLPFFVHVDLLADRNEVHDHPVEQQSGRSVIEDKEEHNGHTVHHEFSGHPTLGGSTGLAYLEGEYHRYSIQDWEKPDITTNQRKGDRCKINN